MAEHTPGPWRVDPGVNGGYTISDCTNGYGLCTRSEWPHRIAESKANAELIAAAPETAAERDRLKASNAELVKTGTEFLEAMSLGPLDSAAKYGPDFDLAADGVRCAANFNAALSNAQPTKEPDHG